MSAEGIGVAAQNHLEGIFGKRHEMQPSARAITTRNYAPQLVKTTTQVSNFSTSRQVHVVSYAQTHRAIPIFGTRAVVELDDSGKLIAAQAKLANVTGVAPTATLTPDKASAALSGLLKLAPKVRKELSRQETSLTFFHDRPSDKWHLAYLFRDVPALPPKPAGARGADKKRPSRHGHGLAGDPRQRFPRLDYLLDANSGEIVYYYSVSPTVARKAPNPVPARLKGLDDEGNAQLFFGLPTKNAFLLHDPSRFIRTHDLRGGSIDDAPVPRNPVSSPKFDFAGTNTAAISAHVNSGFVFDFYNSVLIRRGVDDQGMEVVNVVNCTSPADERPPQWGNAVWWNKKMWYGQMVDGPDKRRSLARYLDVIGHELTHGVTETTSNLVYRDEAGALNESFSDIFGVIINNWTKRRGVDPRQWDWEIGSGLGEKPGNPLRNMKNPEGDRRSRAYQGHADAEAGRAAVGRQRLRVRPHQQQHSQQGRVQRADGDRDGVEGQEPAAGVRCRRRGATLLLHAAASRSRGDLRGRLLHAARRRTHDVSRTPRSSRVSWQPSRKPTRASASRERRARLWPRRRSPARAAATLVARSSSGRGYWRSESGTRPTSLA